MSKVIAVVVSDLHFSHTPPIARSGEPNWYVAQERMWGQIADMSSEYDVPILIAGDVFDKWNPPVELVNFVIKLFTGYEIVAIPGQHDLPNHNMLEMQRSGYGCLSSTNIITDASYSDVITSNGVAVRGFAWGAGLRPTDKVIETYKHKVAIVHKYVWLGAKKYEGAEKSDHIGRALDNLDGYDACIFGDNHKHFLIKNAMNCGGAMRRKSDEIDYKPQFGLLCSDKLASVPFDISQDVMSEALDLEESMPGTEFSKFLKSLSELALRDQELDTWFRAIIRNEELSSNVKTIIKDAIKQARE